MRWHCVTVFAFLVLTGWARAAPLELGAVNEAQLQLPLRANERINPTLIKAQVLLDRAHFSPGEIDGKFGDNFKKALMAFAAARGFNSKGELTDEIWQKLTAVSSEPALTKYTISNDDLGGPFVHSIPTKLEKMKDLPVLAYTSPREKIAEKFHMSPELLSALNPKQKFDTANETIVVANIPENDAPERATRVEVDKNTQILKLFGRDQQLLATYPATVGSTEKPAPSGRLKITGISRKSDLSLQPKIRIQGRPDNKTIYDQAGAQQPGGAGLDRVVRRRLWDPWYPRTVQSEQDGFAWLHSPDELGRSARCLGRGEGNSS